MKVVLPGAGRRPGEWWVMREGGGARGPCGPGPFWGPRLMGGPLGGWGPWAPMRGEGKPRGPRGPGGRWRGADTLSMDNRGGGLLLGYVPDEHKKHTRDIGYP